MGSGIMMIMMNVSGSKTALLRVLCVLMHCSKKKHFPTAVAFHAATHMFSSTVTDILHLDLHLGVLPKSLVSSVISNIGSGNHAVVMQLVPKTIVQSIKIIVLKTYIVQTIIKQHIHFPRP